MAHATDEQLRDLQELRCILNPKWDSALAAVLDELQALRAERDEPSCWHCRVVLIGSHRRPRCEVCPSCVADCEDGDECEQDGCVEARR